MSLRGLIAAGLAAALTMSSTATADSPTNGPDPAQAAPSFVSLAQPGVEGRHGPGLDHRIDWIYQRAGLPLQIIDESGAWRRVRDPDGGEVWMHVDHLDPKRTIMARPTNARELILRRAPNAAAPIVAYLETGVTASLTGCDGEWRRVSIRGRVGWARENQLWGGESCA